MSVHRSDGDISRCDQCGQPIKFIDGHWFHLGQGQWDHRASPTHDEQFSFNVRADDPADSRPPCASRSTWSRPMVETDGRMTMMGNQMTLCLKLDAFIDKMHTLYGRDLDVAVTVEVMRPRT